jgi:hypothetical protein
MSDGADTQQDTAARRFSVALLGGLRLNGQVRLGDRLARVAAIGGMDLDLSEAVFTADRLTVVKVSLIGGLEIRLPAGAKVEIHSFAIGGRQVEDAPAADRSSGPTVVIHAYGILGGVKVRYAG